MWWRRFDFQHLYYTCRVIVVETFRLRYAETFRLLKAYLAYKYRSTTPIPIFFDHFISPKHIQVLIPLRQPALCRKSDHVTDLPFLALAVEPISNQFSVHPLPKSVSDDFSL